MATKSKAKQGKKPAKKAAKTTPKRARLDAPEQLSDAERAVWNEAIDVIRAGGGEKKVNLAILEMYSRAVCRMRDAEAHVAEHGTIVPAPRTGVPMENPYLAVATKSAASVAKCATQLGLDESAAKAPKARSGPMSLNAYGKRRGVAYNAVKKAVQLGRLSESVVIVKGKPKIADPELADHEWDTTTREQAVKKPGDVARAESGLAEGKISYVEARRRREIEKLKQDRIACESDRLNLAKRQGELISVDEVRANVINEYTEVRTKMLGLPTRIRQRVPKLNADDVRIVSDLIREALEALADGD